MDFRGVPPMPMSGNLCENWRFWKQRFQTYLLATEISKKEEVTQCAQLLTLIGEEGMRIFNTFDFAEEGKDVDSLAHAVKICLTSESIKEKNREISSRTSPMGESRPAQVDQMNKWQGRRQEDSYRSKEKIPNNQAQQLTRCQKCSYSHVRGKCPAYGKFFDSSKPVTISVDSSKDGMGAVLLQEGKACAYASRALTETQRRYAQIEKELLSVWFGVTHYSQYVLFARRFVVETDHKPLINIIKKPINTCPARLQRMLVQLRKYDFELVFKPGKQLVVADTLSRAYESDNFDENLDFEAEAQVCLIEENLNATEEKRLQIVKETKSDKTLCPNINRFPDVLENREEALGEAGDRNNVSNSQGDLSKSRSGRVVKTPALYKDFVMM
ncbi:hypothetical protein HUJ05_001516 [Dendroctonus ponderosae]|nr:hypothetical protein HUJ05_001516 [Dendroctonus ponderosae]